MAGKRAGGETLQAYLTESQHEKKGSHHTASDKMSHFWSPSRTHVCDVPPHTCLTACTPPEAPSSAAAHTLLVSSCLPTTVSASGQGKYLTASL